MMFDKSELEGMKMGDLYQIAADMKVEMAQGMSKADLVSRIILKTTMPEPEKPIETPITEAKPVAKVHTSIETLKQAVNAFTLRGMELFHRAEDDTWFMRVKVKPIRVRDTNTGEVVTIERWREDSGTMNQPIETIRRCARVLMSNAPAPRELEPQRGIAQGYEAVA